MLFQFAHSTALVLLRFKKQQKKKKVPKKIKNYTKKAQMYRSGVFPFVQRT